MTEDLLRSGRYPSHCCRKVEKGLGRAVSPHRDLGSGSSRWKVQAQPCCAKQGWRTVSINVRDQDKQHRLKLNEVKMVTKGFILISCDVLGKPSKVR